MGKKFELDWYNFEQHCQNGILTIPDGVNHILESTGIEKNEVNKVIIPSSVKIIGESAFCNFEKLATIEGAENVEEICDAAFCNCSELSQIKLSSSLVKIGEEAFSYTGLTEIEVPDSVISIGESAFSCCDNLKIVKLSKSLTEIKDRTFFKSGLTEIEVPDSVTSIGKSAFDSCNNLEKIKLSETLVEIGEEAFDHCGFSEILIPDSVVKIGENAFSYNDNLKKVTIGKSAKYSYKDNRYNSFSNCENINELIQRSEIAEYTGATHIQNVTICDTVKELGQWAFCNCDFEAIDIPDSVTKIGYGAFVECEQLKEINISDSVTEICQGAFARTSLREIIFPKELRKLKPLGDGFPKLRKLDFSKVHNLKVLPEKFLYQDSIPKLKELVVPIGVNTIEELALSSDSLKSVFLPPTTCTIEELYCKNLKIYCFSPELDELEPLIEGMKTGDEPNILYVLPKYLDDYKNQQIAEEISEEFLKIDVIPEEYQFYYEI